MATHPGHGRDSFTVGQTKFWATAFVVGKLLLERKELKTMAAILNKVAKLAIPAGLLVGGIQSAMYDGN